MLLGRELVGVDDFPGHSASPLLYHLPEADAAKNFLPLGPPSQV